MEVEFRGIRRVTNSCQIEVQIFVHVRCERGGSTDLVADRSVERNGLVHDLEGLRDINFASVFYSLREAIIEKAHVRLEGLIHLEGREASSDLLRSDPFGTRDISARIRESGSGEDTGQNERHCKLHLSVNIPHKQ